MTVKQDRAQRKKAASKKEAQAKGLVLAFPSETFPSFQPRDHRGILGVTGFLLIAILAVHDFPSPYSALKN